MTRARRACFACSDGAASAKRDVQELLDDEDINILLFKNVRFAGALGVGHHIFPFRFLLPDELAPSWNVARKGACWIEHYFEAEM